MLTRGILGVAALALVAGTPACAQTPRPGAGSPESQPASHALLPVHPMTDEMAWGRSVGERPTPSLQCSRYFGCLPRYLRAPVASAPDSSSIE